MKKTYLFISIFVLMFSFLPMYSTTAETGYFEQGSQFDSGGYLDSSQPLAFNWSGHSNIYGSDTSNILWKSDNNLITTAIYPAPVIGKDGTIYHGYGAGFRALNKDGSVKWDTPLPYSLVAHPALATDGTIYVPNNKFTALNPDGTVKWIFTANYNHFITSPAIGSDGTIYTYNNNSQDYAIYAINPDGSLKWKTPKGTFDNSIKSPGGPLIGKNGHIYVVTAKGKVTAVNKTGEVLWKTDAYGAYANYNIAPNGDIYLVIGNMLKILNPADGSLSKEITLPEKMQSFPVFNQDDSSFYIGGSKNLYAFNADGSARWIYQGNASPITGTPIIDAEGTLYFGINTNGFYAIKKDGTVKWKQSTGFTQTTFSMTGNSYAFGPDGTIYGNSNEHIDTGVFQQSIFAIGDPKDQPTDDDDDINACFGYIENLEKKIKKGDLTAEEIQEARYRLIKDLQNLNQIEQGKPILP